MRRSISRIVDPVRVSNLIFRRSTCWLPKSTKSKSVVAILKKPILTASIVASLSLLWLQKKDLEMTVDSLVRSHHPTSLIGRVYPRFTDLEWQKLELEACEQGGADKFKSIQELRTEHRRMPREEVDWKVVSKAIACGDPSLMEAIGESWWYLFCIGDAVSAIH